MLAERGEWTRSGGHCACLRSHPQNSSRAATAPQFSQTVTSIILAYCFKTHCKYIINAAEHPPYSLCPDPVERAQALGESWGAPRHSYWSTPALQLPTARATEDLG